VKERRDATSLHCLAFDGFTLRYAKLFRHRSFICAITDRQDNWCSVEFNFKMTKGRAGEMNIALP